MAHKTRWKFEKPHINVILQEEIKNCSYGIRRPTLTAPEKKLKVEYIPNAMTFRDENSSLDYKLNYPTQYNLQIFLNN